ncbi:hypothetical protein L207DRAFT_565825 [Hyaloscypha variabilis F]|uniref:Clr5 domain-containing protein n=1 Tax=Hyaloscypha variabilis (strain UAMH 11265 / GT02V1 / F) TaxID=1149755 RepID=A0A2J6RPA5_HYAVF|nr:hypothetical protein L207DRAFT_565825 [Hyaloscypha variabilis F]
MEDSPHNTHGVARKTSPGYTEAQWESIKEIVRQCYFEENKTLSNVVDILSKDYGFTLLEKQLKDRLRRWRLQKNIPGDIMKQMAWTRLMREREGKRSKFLFSRRPVPEEKINHYLKGSKTSDEDLLSMPCPVKDQLYAFTIGSGNLDVAPMSLDSSPSNWQYVATPRALDLSSAVLTSRDNYLAWRRGHISSSLPRSVQNRPETPENLLGRFQERICLSLSVTGDEHNLWQKLVLPLVRNSQTLCDSISAVTALHISKDGALHVYGRELLTQSHEALWHEVEAETPSITTLATILILAFWTRWDEGLQFGKSHIICATTFLRKALSQYGALSLSPDFSYYLFTFLYNTYYRMDSLSRLVCSALQTDQSRTMSLPPFDKVFPAYSVLGQDEKPRVDPWMSYVRGLYPLIGRAADLCDRVNSNSTPIITDAESLKFEIETWRPYRTILIEPNGYSLSPELKDDIENMGEAYRYVTLLYLHQVVPEIFRNRAHELAQRVFDHLKKIRSSSRVTIVQNYPLLVAGCEACSVDDRAWVKERWMAMMAWIKVTNIDNCLKITQEVWKRRDIYRGERHKLGIQPGFGDLGATDEKLDQEFTFQGYLHWASAMKYLEFKSLGRVEIEKS